MGRVRSESNGNSEALVPLLMQRAVVDEPRTIADFLTMVVAAETVYTDAAELLQTTVTFRARSRRDLAKHRKLLRDHEAGSPETIRTTRSTERP